MPEHELLETAEDEGGQLTISCDFCNETYVFDADQIRALYIDEHHRHKCLVARA